MEQPRDEIEPVDPKRQAVRWCRAVLWQARRLREAFDPPGPAIESRPGFFDRIGIEQHFLLVALNQVARALRAIGETDELPSELKLLRNVREHWDEWHLPKGSAAAFRDGRTGMSPYTIQPMGDDFVLGGIVSLNEIERLVSELLARITNTD